jgi:opacity protein-like surface antigen
MNCGGAVDWIASVTGKVGYAFGRTLFYGKAGVAWDHQDFSATCNLGPQNGVLVQQQCNNPAGNITNLISVSNNPVGWTIGYGVEFAIAANWSAKAEYNYFDFGTKSLTASDGTQINSGLHMSAVKVGVNYRFGEPSAIAVRY